MTDTAEQDLQAAIQAWDQAAWSLAAAGLPAAPGTPLPGLGAAAPGQIASQAAAALHQASALAGGRGHEWGSHVLEHRTPDRPADADR